MAADIEGAAFEGTGYSYTLSLIQGRHKMAILYCLMEYEPVRFNQMRRYLGNVADKRCPRTSRSSSATGLSRAPSIPRCLQRSNTRSPISGPRSWRCSISFAFGEPSTCPADARLGPEPRRPAPSPPANASRTPVGGPLGTPHPGKPCRRAQGRLERRCGSRYPKYAAISCIRELCLTPKGQRASQWPQAMHAEAGTFRLR